MPRRWLLTSEPPVQGVNGYPRAPLGPPAPRRRFFFSPVPPLTPESTAPTPLFPSADQSNLDRILLNVIDGAPKMPVIADEAIKVLPEPEVARTPQDLVRPVRRERLPGVQDVTQAPRLSGFDQSMYMVRHHAPGDQPVPHAIEEQKGLFHHRRNPIVAKPARTAFPASSYLETSRRSLTSRGSVAGRFSLQRNSAFQSLTTAFGTASCRRNVRDWTTEVGRSEGIPGTAKDPPLLPRDRRRPAGGRIVRYLHRLVCSSIGPAVYTMDRPRKKPPAGRRRSGLRSRTGSRGLREATISLTSA